MPKGVYERKTRPWQERLWEKIDRSGGPDACWPWTASTTHGYGRIMIDRVPELAHRKAYEAAVGPIPPGKHILHSCEARYAPGDFGHRRCCNPAHLRPGNDYENAQDSRRTRRPAADIARRGPRQQQAHCRTGARDP